MLVTLHIYIYVKAWKRKMLLWNTCVDMLETVCACMHACVVNNRVCYNLHKLSTVVASRKHSRHTLTGRNWKAVAGDDSDDDADDGDGVSVAAWTCTSRLRCCTASYSAVRPPSARWSRSRWKGGCWWTWSWPRRGRSWWGCVSATTAWWTATRRCRGWTTTWRTSSWDWSAHSPFGCLDGGGGCMFFVVVWVFLLFVLGCCFWGELFWCLCAYCCVC